MVDKDVVWYSSSMGGCSVVQAVDQEAKKKTREHACTSHSYITNLVNGNIKALRPRVD